MTKKSDTPAIRFKGFSDAWEQRKLGDIGKARSGVGFPDADQGGVTGVPFFKVSDMNLDGNENEMSVANNYVTAEQIADHRWSPITELPAIFFAKVGAAVMLNRKRLCRFPFLLDNNTMAYSLSPTKWDADFAKALFGTVDLTSLVQVGALPSYNAGDVESMEIYLPSLFEQEQVGAFFKQLDNLITLHQRKFEKLTNVKKSMLEKMFPQNGSSYPEIRFKGFTDPWEQRKLAEVLAVTTRKNGNTYTKDDVLSVSDEYGCVNQIRFQGRSFAGEDISNYKIVHTGDIVYTRSPLQAKPYGIIKRVGAETGIVSPLYIVNETADGYDSKFVYYTFDSPQKTNNYLSPLVRKGAKNTMNISNDEWLSGEIMVATSIEEQQHIGVFLETIDNLITLHQRELEKLQNIKKSMLEKMFV